jgi:hypothetical protein
VGTPVFYWSKFSTPAAANFVLFHAVFFNAESNGWIMDALELLLPGLNLAI